MIKCQPHYPVVRSGGGADNRNAPRFAESGDRNGET